MPPIRIVYNLEAEGPHPVSMAVSVPKRLFKRAVDRNLLKRRIREVYRMNKHGLYSYLQQEGIKMNLVIQYKDREIRDYQYIEQGIVKAFEKLDAQLMKQSSPSADNGTATQSDG